MEYMEDAETDLCVADRFLRNGSDLREITGGDVELGRRSQP